jgi:putative endonuclease
VPFVYMLRCRDGSLYTGAAKDLARRVVQHERGTASRYTRSRLPIRLAWSRRVRTWAHALRLEYLIKRLEREQKQALSEGRLACRLRSRRSSQNVLVLIAVTKAKPIR